MMRESMVNEQALPKVTVKSKKSDSMNLAIRRLKSNLAHWLFLISTLIGVVVLAVLLMPGTGH